MTAFVLLVLALVLVAVGSWMHVAGELGWAQFMFVLASGCAGGAVVEVLNR